ncbi:MAG TPA: DUF4340 domain-containing protein [Clostridiales bacterium]|nr:DUF4340 domain-containing protein [Clostridiales bacterium]
MAKGKRKNAITLVVLLLALGVLVCLYFWYDSYQKHKESAKPDTDQAVDLATVDTEQVDSLHYVRNDADLTFILKEGVWVDKDNTARPINQEHVTSMLNAVKTLKADRVIMESPDNLSDYGLEQPQAVLTVTMKDKSTVSVKLGNKVVDSSGYYGLVNEDSTVYLLQAALGNALQYSDLQMTALPEAPSITAENITHILVDNREGEDYELAYSDEEKLDNTGSNMYAWQFLKPYGEGYTADSTKVSDLQANYTGFDYINCVDYKGEDLDKYGLEEPAASILIGYFVSRTEALPTPETDPGTGKEITEKTYKDPYEYKIYIGNQDESGNYYVRIDGSDSVYTMSSDTVDKMCQIDSFSLLNRYILLPALDNVDQVTAQVEGTTYQMGISRKTSTDKDGKETTASAYTFNGKESEEDAFKKLYQQLIGITYDSQIPSDVTVGDETPYLTLTYHIFGDNERTVSASFLPYDDDFYIVKKNGDTRFFADKRAVQDIAKALSSFTGKKAE